MALLIDSAHTHSCEPPHQAESLSDIKFFLVLNKLQRKAYLVSLELKEAVEIVGAERGAELGCRGFAVAQIRMARTRFGSESIESAGLVRVL